MSGIEKMMSKMKSKKMTLDDLPSPILKREKGESSVIQQYSNTSSENTVHMDEQPAVQSSVRTAIQPTVLHVNTVETIAVQHLNTEIQQHSNSARAFSVDGSKSALEEVGNPSVAREEGAVIQKRSELHSQQTVNDVKTATQQNSNTVHLNPDSLHKEGIPTGSQMKKVTYYLTPEMHKAFNDVFAKRMLEGRQTAKQDLISEAVELLYRQEMNRN